MNLDKVCEFLEKLYSIGEFQDYSNNGVQVEGKSEVRKIALAVDASLRSIELAAENHADMLLVHHGLSWGEGFKRLTGMDAARFRALFNAGITLYACHLPMDAHPEIGHNAVLAKAVGLVDCQPFLPVFGREIGVCGKLPAPMMIEKLTARVQSSLEWVTSRVVLPENWGKKKVRSLAIVSGSGGDAVTECAVRGIDCLLTGETSHQHINTGRELGIPVITAGHYATEMLGLQALQPILEKKLKVETCFLDVPTGF